MGESSHVISNIELSLTDLLTQTYCKESLFSDDIFIDVYVSWKNVRYQYLPYSFICIKELPKVRVMVLIFN